jgi:protein-tyrosine-phosphatase
MRKILFLCTGNMNRSWAAHMIADEMLLDDIESAGTGKTCGGKKPNKMMVDALARRYYPWTVNRKSKKVTEDLLDWADVVVCLAAVHRRKIIEQFGLTYASKCVMFMPDGSDVPDPHFSKDPADFDSVVDSIISNMRQF